MLRKNSKNSSHKTNSIITASKLDTLARSVLAPEKASGIYRIVCIKNGRYYYGSSQDINKRWKYHKWAFRNDSHINSHMQNAWNKYGETSFHCEIVELVSIDRLLKVENIYLKEHVEKRSCFNIALDATAPMKGKIHSEETKRKQSEANTGKTHSEKAKQKMSKAHKGLIPWNKGMKGGKRSEETKQKISSARKGKAHSEKTKQKIGEAVRQAWIKRKMKRR